MGDRRIVDLTAETSFASGDVLAVDNANNTETKKITAANAITTPINNVSQKVSGSSDAYSSSKAYSVGDLVIYNNIVYKCTTACSAASWSVNQNNFTATTLAETVTALNNDLKWKYFNYVIGSTEISLPSDWEELLIQVTHSNGEYLTAYFLRNMTTQTMTNVSLNSYGSSYAIGALSQSKYKLVQMYWGSDVTASTWSYIYYR